MGLKKHNPGCDCCESGCECSAATPELEASVELTFYDALIATDRTITLSTIVEDTRLDLGDSSPFSCSVQLTNSLTNADEWDFRSDCVNHNCGATHYATRLFVWDVLVWVGWYLGDVIMYARFKYEYVQNTQLFSPATCPSNHSVGVVDEVIIYDPYLTLDTDTCGTFPYEVDHTSSPHPTIGDGTGVSWPIGLNRPDCVFPINNDFRAVNWLITISEA